LVHGFPPAGVWQAPGGLALLGGPGAALAIAVPWVAVVAAAPRADGLIEMYSTNRHAEPLSTRLSDLGADPAPPWTAPSVRAVRVLRDAGHPLGGAAFVVNTQLPHRTGFLSAGEACAVSLALRDMYNVNLATEDLSDDPAYAAALHGQSRRALLVRDGGVEPLPFDLASAGLRLLFIDVDATAAAPATDSAVAATAAAGLLRAGDLAGLGSLLTAAHASRVRELDLALDAALRAGALGGRATGPCLTALVPIVAVPAVRSAVTAALAGTTRRGPRFLTAVAVAGACRAA
jgi:Galactokinase